VGMPYAMRHMRPGHVIYLVGVGFLNYVGTDHSISVTWKKGVLFSQENKNTTTEEIQYRYTIVNSLSIPVRELRAPLHPPIL